MGRKKKKIVIKLEDDGKWGRTPYHRTTSAMRSRRDELKNDELVREALEYDNYEESFEGEEEEENELYEEDR